MTHALIFANGDLNDGALVQQVLATAHGALIVAADGGARMALALGLRPHLVIGDMDSLEANELMHLEKSGAEILRYPAEKNETDLELALLLVAARGATWLRIIGGVGDRLDQTMSNVYLMALPELRAMDVRMVAGKQEMWLLPAGTHTLQGAKGDTISLLPLSGAVSGITTEGLYYALRDETLAFGPARGVSNVMRAAQARVQVASGTLLCVHTLGRA
jgi:thiamine pyrophosphokinase